MLKYTLDTAFTKAKQFTKKNDNDKAKEIYETILKKFPSNQRARTLLNDLSISNLNTDLRDIKKLYFQNEFFLADNKCKTLFENYKNNSEFLYVFATIKAEMGQLSEAETLFKKLYKIDINNYAALTGLGNIYYLQNKFDEATIHFKKSLEINHQNNKDKVIALNGLALLHTNQENLDQATELFEQVIKLDPSFNAAYINFGNCLKKGNKLEDALVNYEKALKIIETPEVINNIGTIHQMRGDLSRAKVYYNKAINIKNDYVTALRNRGTVFFELENYEEALIDFKKCVSLDKNIVQNFISVGNVYFKTEKFSDALNYYAQALEINNLDHNTLNNIGHCYNNLKQFERSIEFFDKAIDLKLDFVAAYNNKGTALNMLSKFDEALECLSIAANLEPKNPNVWLNKGNIAFIQSKYADATKYLIKAIELDNDYADAYFNLALIRLLHCDFASGLKLFEWRLKKTGSKRIFNKKILKRWNGKDNLNKKTIVVLAEQGLGDTIQFCRFAKRLIQKNCKIIFKVQDCLVDLIKTLDNDINVIPDSLKVHINDFDYQIPLMSIPYALNYTFSDLSFEKKYLSANSKLIKKWEKINKNGSFKIGICWQGSNSEADRYRSFSLNEFKIFSDMKNIQLISLQKDNIIDNFNNESSLKIMDLSDKIDKGDQAFTDTSAIIQNLDLVITCDTSIGHLAGALNCPTWIVLGKAHDWRWFFNENSVWYPSVKIFRQEKIENWSHPFEQMKEELKKILN